MKIQNQAVLIFILLALSWSCKLNSVDSPSSAVQGADGSLSSQQSIDGSYKDSCISHIEGEHLVATCKQDKDDQNGVLSALENISTVCGKMPVANTKGTLTCGEKQAKKPELPENFFKNKPIGDNSKCDMCLDVGNAALACRCGNHTKMILTILSDYRSCKGEIGRSDDGTLRCDQRLGTKIVSKFDSPPPPAAPSGGGATDFDWAN
jgi:hypothetical protein